MNAHRTEILIVGGGIAGIVAALELLRAGKQVTILDRDVEGRFGGLAKEAFGGMALCGTKVQAMNGVKDNPELMYRDWLSFAEFGEQDHWPKHWAEMYCHRNHQDVYRWLQENQVRFFPAVNWVERGEYMPGNSVPRYHIVWGTGWQLTEVLIQHLRAPRVANKLKVLFEHRVDAFITHNETVTGVCGLDERTGKEFEIEADVTIAATGGINGDLERVRKHWPEGWGHTPYLLNGSHKYSDGLVHDAVEQVGGQVTHLDWQWNYAAGIRHPKPRMPDHGLSLIPPKSALWMNARGRRIGPHPLVTGFDTHGMCQRISNMEHAYSWQVMNQKIARKEISISGSEHNPAFRDRKPVTFLKEILLGNDTLYDYLVSECEDVIVANGIDQLAEKMNELSIGTTIDVDGMKADIRHYDSVIDRGAALHNDDQLRRIEHARRWKGDRIRTLKHQKIEDPKAGPLVAIREFIISRKSMGGIQTDDHSRVLSETGGPIEGLYAVGEAAGFGGGGANGKRSLEGTFLSLCVLTARVAARSIIGKANP